MLDFFAPVIDTYDTGNNKAVDLIYLDTQKAFDKVPHERRLVKRKIKEKMFIQIKPFDITMSK